MSPPGRSLLLTLAVVACQPSGERPAPAEESARSEMAAHYRRLGEGDAAVDLAAGEPATLTGSGPARYSLTPDYDAFTGLPARDTGCVRPDDYHSGYNATIHAWMRAHGPHPTSRKADFLEAAEIDALLDRGTPLVAGAPVTGPEGATVELVGERVRVTGAGFTPPLLRSLGLDGKAHLTVAWGPRRELMVRIVGPSHEGFRGDARIHLDARCRCLLQVVGG